MSDLVKRLRNRNSELRRLLMNHHAVYRRVIRESERREARAEGAAVEREECAKLAESMCRCDPCWAPYGRVDPSCGAHDIADVIRDRGQP